MDTMETADARLTEAPDRGLVPGLLIRAGLRRTIRVWGLRLWAPPSVVPRRAAYAMRSGRYEWPEAFCATHTLDPALPLVEAGAGIGAVSCHANRLLARPEDHVAIEMNRRVLPVLGRNRDGNGARFEIVWGAVGTGVESPSFDAWSPGAPYSASTHPDVPRVRLSELLGAKKWDRVNLMLDVEGAELELLDDDPGLFDHVDRFVAEFHPYQRAPPESGRFVRRLGEFGLEPHVVYGAVMGFVRQKPPPGRRAR